MPDWHTKNPVPYPTKFTKLKQQEDTTETDLPFLVLAFWTQTTYELRGTQTAQVGGTEALEVFWFSKQQTQGMYYFTWL